VAVLFEHLPEGALDFFRRKPLAVYLAYDLEDEGCTNVVEALKSFAVIGVVEREAHGLEWGKNFCWLAACFYTTGFRPLLLNFLGEPERKNLSEIISVLRRSYRLGWVNKPVIRLGGMPNIEEENSVGFGRRARRQAEH